MPFNSETQPASQNRWITSLAERLGLANTPFQLLALAPLFIWLLVYWFQTLLSVIHSYNPLPVWDYWRVVRYLHQYQAFDWSVLWVQHNEHRILFPEIIFAIDTLFFHDRQVLPLIANVLCYFLVWIVLATAFYAEKSMSRLVCIASILVAGAIIGWPGCTVVVGSSFLLQWTMLQLATILALYLLTKIKHPAAWPYLSGTILCAIIATYSSGNGMLLWPILLGGALLLRISKAQVFTLIAAAILSVSLYFVGYKPSNDLNILALIQHPIYFVGFLASYLSMPFGAISGSHFALIVGGFNILVFIAVLTGARRYRLIRSDLSVLLFGSYLFALLSAALTAAGRMNPADPQFIAAKAARYVSLPLVNWAVLLLAVIWLSSKRKWDVFSPGNIIFITSMILLSAFLRLGLWQQGNNLAVADQQWATLSVESRLFEPTIIDKLFPDPNFVKQSLPTLQQNHLSIYWHQPDATWIGHSAKSEFPGTWGQKTGGKVSQIYPITGGAEITGIEPNIKPGEKLVLVDDHDEIVGLGEKLPAGTPTLITPVPDSNDHSNEWVGFLNTAYSSKAFSVFLVNAHSLTQITDSMAIPQLREATAPEIGAPIANVTWQASHWSPGVFPAAVQNDHQGSSWSSWNGSDASTGQIASSAILVPTNHCIILPILHGPSVQGLSAQIVNSQTDRTIETLPMQNGEAKWKLWRLPIDTNVASIKILGRDAGAGWGQWLAIGNPELCR